MINAQTHSKKDAKRDDTYMTQISKFNFNFIIQFEKQFIHYSMPIQQLIEGVTYCQLISLYLSQIEERNGIQNNMLRTLYMIVNITRPYQYLKSTEIFFQYSSLIPLVWITILVLGLIAIFLVFQMKKTELNCIFKITQKLQQPYKLLALFIVGTFTIYDKIIFFVWIECAIQQFVINSNSTINIIFTIIGILTLIILLLFHSYFKVLFQTSVFNLNLSRFNHSFIIYLDNLLIIFNIALKSVNNQEYFIFQEILIILFCLNRSIISFTLYDTLYEIQKISIAFQILIYLLIIVLNESLEYYFDERSIIILSLYPLLLFIILNIHKQCYNLVMQQFNQECDRQLYKLQNLAQLMNQQQCNVSVMIQFYVYLHSLDATQNSILEQNSFQDLLISYMQQNNQYLYENLQNLKDQNLKLHFYLQCIQFNQQIIKLQRKDISKEFLKQKSLITNIFRKVTNENFTENHSSEVQSKVQNKKYQFRGSLLFKEIKFQNLNMIQQQKLDLVLSNIKRQLVQDIQYKEHDNLSIGVQLFLQSEQNIIQMTQKIKKSIQQKRDFLIQFLESNRKYSFFQEGLKLTGQLQKIEIFINEQYEKFPIQKIQTMLIFFYSEIMNNYLKAFKIQNLTTISDEQLIKLHSMTEFDFFSNKLQYVITNIDQADLKLRIIQKSQDLHQILQIPKKAIQSINLIEQILPRGFERIHKNLILQFLKTGSSKYYKKINLNYIQTGNKFLRQVNFFYDNNFTNLNDLSFIGFFQEISIQDCIIFVGLNKKILGISTNLANKFGIQSKYNDNFRSSLIRQNITKFINNFDELVDKYDQINLFSNDQDQFCIYQNQFKLNHKDYYQQDQYDISNLNYQTYLVDMVISQRNVLEGESYYIVEIKNAKLFNDQNQNQNQNDIPAESPAELRNKRQSQQIEIKKSLIFNQQQQIYSQFECIFTIRSRNDEFQIHDKLMLNDTPIQQVYFNKLMSQRSSLSLNSIENYDFKEEGKQLAILNQNEIDQDLQKNDLFHNKQNKNIVHVDNDIGSQAESAAGFRQSRYFKKYEFLEKIINYKKVPIQINLYILLLLLMICIGLVQSFLFIINSTQDLDRFLKEIDMIQIQSNFIGPLDKYIVCLNANINSFILYGLYLQITAIQFGQRMAYSSFMVNKTYFELKQSFDEQLNNPYVTPFINDKYVSVYQIQIPPDMILSNITIIESLNILLEASYRFKSINVEEIITVDLSAGYLSYLLKNYIVFKKLFLEINNNMLNYSVQRSLQVQDKWLAIQLPYYLLCIISLSLAFIQFYKYIKNQLKIKHLFELSKIENFDNQLDKLNQLLKIIKQDEKIITQYQFDLDTKENQLIAEDLKKDQQKQEAQLKKLMPQKLQLKDNFESKSLIINFIILISIYGLYLTFMIISQINGQRYFQRYPQTAEYFNSLADITVASSGIHSMHIFAYQTSMGYFPYISIEETQQYLYYFDNNINIINNFLIMSSKLESLNLFITDEYIQLANKIMNSDVCAIQLRQDLIDNFCDVTYGGAFRRGLYTGITAVRDYLLNEKVLNYNFSYYDFLSTDITLEGGLISTEALFILKQKYLTILVDLTNQLSSFIQIMNMWYIGLSLFLIIIMTSLREYYQKQFQLTLRMVLLIPLKSLLLDSQVERELRQFATQQQIV